MDKMNKKWWVVGLCMVCAAASAADAGHGAAETMPAVASKAAEPSKAEQDDLAKKTAEEKKQEKAEPASLAEQIKDALAGKGGSTLNLGKPSAAKPEANAHAPAPAAHSKPGAQAHAPAVSAKPVPKAHAAAAHGATVKPSDKSRREIKAMGEKMTGHGAQASGGHAHWAYEGEAGPEHWADLDPAFENCRVGKRQSPIHIESDKAMSGPADELEFAYKSTPAKVVNNGHTFQVDLAEGSSLVARGETYKLAQFHFHHPSEERVDYKGFPMVAHLVHKSDSGYLAVVAVELELGAANPVVAQAWRSLPLDEGDKSGISGGLNPDALLPSKDKRKYFQFIGSLTTPPCSEGVLWMVLKQPMTISKEQLAVFKRFFPMNARPVQPLHGRLVREQE